MSLRRWLPCVVLGAVFLALWELSCLVFSVREYILPRPSQIAVDLVLNLRDLVVNTLVTLLEAGAGFVVANLIAIGTAVLMVYVRNLDRALLPFAIALKTTPIVAMAPLLLIWFGSGYAPKIAAAALISFFPALVNSLKGFNALGEGEENLFRVYGASKTQVLLKLRFRRAAPYLFSAFKVSSSLAIVGAIVGEFVGANSGIGYVILVSSYHLETTRMFSALAMAALGGIVMYSLIAIADDKVVYWLVHPLEEYKIDASPKGRPLGA